MTKKKAAPKSDMGEVTSFICGLIGALMFLFGG